MKHPARQAAKQPRPLWQDRARQSFYDQLGRLSDLMGMDAPDVILAHATVNLWQAAILLFGEAIFQEQGKRAVAEARMYYGVCQTCDVELPPHLTHLPVCTACMERMDREYGAILKEDE